MTCQKLFYAALIAIAASLGGCTTMTGDTSATSSAAVFKNESSGTSYGGPSPNSMSRGQNDGHVQ